MPELSSGKELRDLSKNALKGYMHESFSEQILNCFNISSPVIELSGEFAKLQTRRCLVTKSDCCWTGENLNTNKKKCSEKDG